MRRGLRVVSTATLGLVLSCAAVVASAPSASAVQTIGSGTFSQSGTQSNVGGTVTISGSGSGKTGGGGSGRPGSPGSAGSTYSPTPTGCSTTTLKATSGGTLLQFVCTARTVTQARVDIRYYTTTPPSCGAFRNFYFWTCEAIVTYGFPPTPPTPPNPSAANPTATSIAVGLEAGLEMGLPTPIVALTIPNQYDNAQSPYTYTDYPTQVVMGNISSASRAASRTVTLVSSGHSFTATLNVWVKRVPDYQVWVPEDITVSAPGGGATSSAVPTNLPYGENPYLGPGGSASAVTCSAGDNSYNWNQDNRWPGGGTCVVEFTQPNTSPGWTLTGWEVYQIFYGGTLTASWVNGGRPVALFQNQPVGGQVAGPVVASPPTPTHILPAVSLQSTTCLGSACFVSPTLAGP
ncbi:MAG: hypothetical protein M0Z91_07495 [Actinomycetota bacterium]|nr:hypothetical protein [Actinomycetota bacterium]